MGKDINVHTRMATTLYNKYFLVAVTDLCPLDDHCVGRQVDSPGQCCCGDKDLNVLVSKEFLYKCAVHTVHACMMDGKAIGKEVLQLVVLRLDV